MVFDLVAARLQGLGEERHADLVLAVGGRRAIGIEIDEFPVFGRGQDHVALVALPEIGVGDEELGPLGVEALGEGIDDLAEIEEGLLGVLLDRRLAELEQGLVGGGDVGGDLDLLSAAGGQEEAEGDAQGDREAGRSCGGCHDGVLSVHEE